MKYRVMLFENKDGTGGTGSGSSSSGSGGTGTATGSGSSSSGSNSTGTGSQYESRSQGAADIVDRLVMRYGNEREALRVLAGENYDFRDRDRTRTQEIDGLRAKQIPDGAIVLTGDDAKHFNAIKALNVPLADVATRVKEAGELKERQQQADRRKAQDSAATSLKWNADVLAPLLDTNKLDIELRDVEVQQDGKTQTVKRPYVRKQGDANAAWEKLDELVARDASLKNFLPALKTVPQTGAAGTTGNGAAGSTGQGAGTGSSSGTSDFNSIPFPVDTGSSSGGSSSGGDAVDRFIQRTNKANESRTNPLRRPTTPQNGTTGAATR